MGIFSRFSDIVNSNINAILDKAEDPEKLVRLMIQEMEDTLVEVRSAAARSIADKKELARTLSTLQREVRDWHDKAELAISKGRDDLAKAALAEKSKVSASVDGLNKQIDTVEDGLAKLNTDIAKLEDKLADAKTRQKAIIARHTTASRRLKVRKKIHNPKVDDALVRFETFERRMEDLEGRVEAYDLGNNKDLRGEFVDLEAEESVERELATMKAKITGQSASDETH